MKQKILKIKVGDVFVDGKNIPVMQTAFQKKSKDGNTYYIISNPVFVQEIEVNNHKQEKESLEA
ncbi:MAG TPA: hypothetical protein P5277_01290 [Candidatus Paceibacterota bacterium]|nr:hypothetical protein [Candidatus Paceibacterota bacterium]